MYTFFSTVMVKKFTRPILFEKQNIPLLKKHRYKKNLFIIEDKLFTSFNRKSESLNFLIKELINLPETIQYFDRSYINFVSKTKLPNKQTNELKKVHKNTFI